MICFYLKEIRIIKIIKSEIMFYKNNTHFWRNYSNYSNFFPKKMPQLKLVSICRAKLMFLQTFHEVVFVLRNDGLGFLDTFLLIGE